MRILISTAAWGDHYRKLFADWSLASLLAPGNLPALAARHYVTLQIVTRREDVRWLWSHLAVDRLQEFADLDLILMEDRGITEIPDERSPMKYEMVTKLQNIAIRTACRHDAVIFNYADFIWSDESLPNAVGLLGDADAVLGFCLPVDLERGKGALSNHCRDNALTVHPRELAAIALDNLHAEANYRFWDAREFSRFPSYTIHPNGGGVEVRAYHQTALVARTRALEGGIRCGTLDGEFTAQLARSGPVVHADDSDRVMVISLHDGVSNPHMRGGRRDQIMREFAARCSPEQRAFAQVPLRISR